MKQPEAATDDAGRPGARSLIVGWLLAFVAYRALVLFFGFDGVYYWEETYRLLIAEALVDGWNIPVYDLQADPYAGGSLVMGLLVTPLVALGISSLFSLKFIALLWSAAGLFLWFRLIDAYFGRRAANLFSLCYIAAPPIFVTYNLIAMGSHAEIVTLSAAQFLLMLRYVRRTARRRDLVAWMVVAGLSIWFTYVSALTLAVCAAYALAVGALPLRRWPLAAAALALGVAPWLVYNLQNPGAGLDVLHTAFAPTYGLGRGRAGTLVHLVTAGIPMGLRFDLRLAGYVYYAGFLVAWTAAALQLSSRRGQTVQAWALQRPELPLLALFPLFVIAITMSSHDFNERGLVSFLSFRILVPAMPAMFFALALSLSRLQRRWLANAAVTAILLWGTAAGLQLAGAGHEQRPRLEAAARATGAEAMGHLLVYKHGADMEHINSRVAAIDDKQLKAAAYRGVGFSLAYLHRFSVEREPEAIVDDLMAAPPGYRQDVKTGIMTALGSGLAQVRAVPPSPRTERMAKAIFLDPQQPHQ